MNDYFGTTNSATTDDGRTWAEQWKEACERMLAFQREWDEKTRKSVEALRRSFSDDPCPECGFVIQTDDSGRVFTVCAHVYAEVEKAVPKAELAVSAFGCVAIPLDAIEIHVAEEVQP